MRTKSFAQRIMTLVERGDAYVVLPGGTGTLAELALSWEMMNKSVLAKTLGGPKPLLVMAPYWQPVIDCLKQERSLAAQGASGGSLPWPGSGVITLVSTVREAALELERLLPR